MKINNLELEKRIDKNLKALFKPLIDDDIKYLKDEKYYHFLDEKLYSFLDKYLEEVDSISWESLEALKDDLGQYVYMAYLGEPISLEWFIKLKEDEEFDDNSFSFEYLDSFVEIAKWRSKEIKESEPIIQNDIYGLIIQSFLELYNKKT